MTSAKREGPREEKINEANSLSLPLSRSLPPLRVHCLFSRETSGYEAGKASTINFSTSKLACGYDISQGFKTSVFQHPKTVFCVVTFPSSQLSVPWVPAVRQTHPGTKVPLCNRK